jgi:NhaP-type Na+/H+ or K+/H+ antiporter
MITIFFSVLAHGMSAAPLTNWYARRIAQLQKDGLVQAETKFVPELPTRKASLPINTTVQDAETVKKVV